MPSYTGKTIRSAAERGHSHSVVVRAEAGRRLSDHTLRGGNAHREFISLPICEELTHVRSDFMLQVSIKMWKAAEQTKEPRTTLFNLVPSETYIFRVKAFNASGESSFSEESEPFCLKVGSHSGTK